MVTGTKISYYFICKRKLWLSSNGVTMEHESDVVAQGKIISETTYKDKKHEINIDGVVVLDFIDLKERVIHEVKKSDKMEEAHLWQVKYYIWYLKQQGITDLTGEIDYPKLKRRETVMITPDDEARLVDIIEDIERIERLSSVPEKIDKKFCKKCAYYELCWS